MTRRGALVVASLAAALLATFGAAARPAAGSARVNGTVDSVLFSVSLPLFAAAGLFVVWSFFRMLSRRGRGSTDEAPEPRPWWQQVIALALVLALLALVVYLVLSSPHHHLHTAAGGASPLIRHGARSGRVVRVNDVAVATSSAVVVILCGLFFLRRYRPRLGLSRLVPSASTATLDSPVRPVGRHDIGGDATLDDPFSEKDPARSVVLAFHRFVALMARAGWARADHETASEFSRRAGRSPALADEGGRALRLADLFGAARYGPGPIGEAERSHALECLTALSSRLDERE